jgi:hypothetical protein
MRVEPEDRARGDGSASARARIRLLPRPVLLVALLLFLAALAPAAGELVAVLGTSDGPAWLGMLARHSALASGLSLTVALGALLVLERPRSSSPVTYARQLRDLWLPITSSSGGPSVGQSALKGFDGSEGEWLQWTSGALGMRVDEQMALCPCPKDPRMEKLIDQCSSLRGLMT